MNTMNWQLKWDLLMSAEECPITFECSATVGDVATMGAAANCEKSDHQDGDSASPAALPEQVKDNFLAKAAGT
ncbi:MAG TPA: hypothetical protein VN643_21855 [Pyrinomonadaceae bacterium]|nr:hypothetical protein [Pyrinomonadaceae bacterium]